MPEDKKTKDEVSEEESEDFCCCQGCPSKDSCVESDDDEKLK